MRPPCESLAGTAAGRPIIVRIGSWGLCLLCGSAMGGPFRPCHLCRGNRSSQPSSEQRLPRTRGGEAKKRQRGKQRERPCGRRGGPVRHVECHGGPGQRLPHEPRDTSVSSPKR